MPIVDEHTHLVITNCSCIVLLCRRSTIIHRIKQTDTTAIISLSYFSTSHSHNDTDNLYLPSYFISSCSRLIAMALLTVTRPIPHIPSKRTDIKTTVGIMYRVAKECKSLPRQLALLIQVVLNS